MAKMKHMYIPIKMLLRALLKHTDVFAKVLNGHTSPDHKLCDYCDGIAFQNNLLFSTDKSTLQINLYHDDFQVVNPLGPRTQTYKLAEKERQRGKKDAYVPIADRSERSKEEAGVQASTHTVNINKASFQPGFLYTPPPTPEGPVVAQRVDQRTRRGRKKVKKDRSKTHRKLNVTQKKLKRQ